MKMVLKRVLPLGIILSACSSQVPQNVKNNTQVLNNPNGVQTNRVDPSSAKIQEELEKTLDSLSKILRKRYALASMKKARFDWTADNALEAVLEQSKKVQNMTIENAQRMVSMYLESARDQNLKALFANRPFLSLGISIEMVEGKAFVSSIDKNLVSALKVGDEVVEYDGVPVADAVKLLMNTEFPGNASADLREGTRRLTEINAMFGEATPSKQGVILSVRRLPKPIALKWRALNPAQEIAKEGKVLRLSGAKKMDSAYFNAWIGESGSKTKVGYLRIPSLTLKDAAAYKRAMSDLDSIMTAMNESSDVMVLDLMGVRGGEDEMVIAIAQRLVKEAAALPLFQYRASEALAEAVKEKIEGYTRASSDADAKNILGGSIYKGLSADMNLIRAMAESLQSVANAEKAGDEYTQPIPYITAQVKPFEGAYQKPMIVLADGETSGAAERLVSVLKDAGRAQFLGTQTAGVGSRSEDFIEAKSLKLENNLGIQAIRIPQARALRAAGEDLENAGVSPSAELALSEADFTESKIFGAFSSAVIKAAKALVKEPSTK